LWLPLRNRHFQGERLATRFAKTLRFSRRSLRERPRIGKQASRLESSSLAKNGPLLAPSLCLPISLPYRAGPKVTA